MARPRPRPLRLRPQRPPASLAALAARARARGVLCAFRELFVHVVDFVVASAAPACSTDLVVGGPGGRVFGAAFKFYSFYFYYLGSRHTPCAFLSSFSFYFYFLAIGIFVK